MYLKLTDYITWTLHELVPLKLVSSWSSTMNLVYVKTIHNNLNLSLHIMEKVIKQWLNKESRLEFNEHLQQFFPTTLMKARK